MRSTRVRSDGPDRQDWGNLRRLSPGGSVPGRQAVLHRRQELPGDDHAAVQCAVQGSDRTGPIGKIGETSVGYRLVGAFQDGKQYFTDGKNYRAMIMPQFNAQYKGQIGRARSARLGKPPSAIAWWERSRTASSTSPTARITGR